MVRDVDELESEVADLCGVINAATARLVGLIGRVLEAEAWHGAGILSPEHWVQWRCGVSRTNARALVAMARALPDRPATRAAFEDGRLTSDQATLICRLSPPGADADVAAFAEHATVSQLRRTLADYTWPEPEDEAEREEPRQVGFGHTDEGTWTMSTVLPPDEGSLVERALTAARADLIEQGERAEDVTWADALVAMAERSLATGAAARPSRDRHLLLIHLRHDESGEPHAHLHVGPALPASLRRCLGCDGRVRPVHEVGGKAVNAGRTARIVPDRTRLVVEERDRGCRVPGCDHTKWLEIHHLWHWEDGGPTDTWNLVALCSRHHRLHHRGHLRIEGNADDPDGLVFSDARGRPLGPAPRPSAPRDPGIRGNWVHPSGERFDHNCVDFDVPEAS